MRFSLTLVVAAAPGTAAPNFIHAEGTQLVDAQGERFAVKGINLGNWLVPEGYMFKFARKRAPSEIAEVIEALVGPGEAARFWAAFREDYITETDIRFIKAAGFNTVRVPLHWRLFVEPGAADGRQRRHIRRAGLGAARPAGGLVPRRRSARDRRPARRAGRTDRRQS